MTTEEFSPTDRSRFCDEIDAISPVRKFFMMLNNYMMVRAANRLNKEACAAYNRDDLAEYLVKRYQSDVLWTRIYRVKMWEHNK